MESKKKAAGEDRESLRSSQPFLQAKQQQNYIQDCGLVFVCLVFPVDKAEQLDLCMELLHGFWIKM